MSNIAGFFYATEAFLPGQETQDEVIDTMLSASKHRGPDESHICRLPLGRMGKGVLLAASLPCDVPCAPQPYTFRFASIDSASASFNHTYTSVASSEASFTILYDGTITNWDVLLSLLPNSAHNRCQEQILIELYLTQGPDFIRHLEGSFALALWDSTKQTLYLYRDALGLRPLFYHQTQHGLLFASTLRSILTYPGMRARIGLEELNELFAMGPSSSLGKSVFRGILQVLPGTFVAFSKNGIQHSTFHTFQSKEHTDSYSDTLIRLNDLLTQSVHTASHAKAPIASLLSGGLDSSYVTALAYGDGVSHTYSFDFLGSKKHFIANAFQPSLDDPFVDEMVDYLGTEHQKIICGNEEQIAYLKNSVLAHDTPAMGDIDSSFLYFLRQVSKDYPVVLTGECSDELFCGYPWYHKDTLSTAFPWMPDLSPRKRLLSKPLLAKMDMESYVSEEYQRALSMVPDATEHQQKMFLTIRYFMQTLVDRTDRLAAYLSMDARVPFASLPMAEYLYNIPYEWKTKNGEVKHLLRELSHGLLPESVRTRKKSPFPKTYDPNYEALLKANLAEVLNHSYSPLLALIDTNAMQDFLAPTKGNYTTPWFGQLMADPQLAAYYLQINYWLDHYQVELSL